MPTPSTGAISFSDIASIVYNNATAQISLNDTNVRILLDVSTSAAQISMTNARGKPVAGSNSYSTPGTYTFLTPPYQTLNVDVRGAGGGGGGGGTFAFPCGFLGPCPGSPGTNGGESRFASSTPVVAGGGFGGNGAPECSGSGPGGGNGTGSGGVNQGAGGGAGGAGGSPNGGCAGRPGGTGNRQTKSWTFNSTAGHPTWSSSYQVVVGQGGAGGGGNRDWGGGPGGTGANGSVLISWS
jgi:hypothetical protein